MKFEFSSPSATENSSGQKSQDFCILHISYWEKHGLLVFKGSELSRFEERGFSYSL
jgi:hypothetical protein